MLLCASVIISAIGCFIYSNVDKLDLLPSNVLIDYIVDKIETMNTEAQKILVNCDLEAGLATRISMAAFLGITMNKEICFCASFNASKYGEEAKVQERLLNLKYRMHESLPELQSSIFSMPGTFELNLERLIAGMNVILFIQPATITKDIKRSFYESPVPFLFIPESFIFHGKIEHILTGVGYHKNSKDAIIWSSYFGRFCRSKVHVVCAGDAEAYAESEKGRVCQSAQRLLKSVGVEHEVLPSEFKSGQLIQSIIDSEYFKIADVVVVSGKHRSTVFHHFGKNPELALLKKAERPVMFLNPMEDLIVLCD